MSYYFWKITSCDEEIMQYILIFVKEFSENSSPVQYIINSHRSESKKIKLIKMTGVHVLIGEMDRNNA